MIRLHLLGFFHSIHTHEFSPCPFTGKMIRFPKMMKNQGFEIIEYSNEGSISVADQKVTILDKETFYPLHAQLKERRISYQGREIDSELFRAYDRKLEKELTARIQPYDIVCHPYGHIHSRFQNMFPNTFHIETGVGYTGIFPTSMKVFESYAWWHWHQGRDNGRAGHNYEWVIPMYYDTEEWTPSYNEGSYILCFGRVIPDKGLAIVQEIAKRTNREVIICGEGDPTPWLTPAIPNLKYLPPVNGLERSELLRNAYCVLMPTQYTEPFGSAGLEAMLCGTPLISSDFGGFAETVQHGFTGYRCKTLGDWLYGVHMAGKLDRKAIAEYTRGKYGLEAIAPQFTRVFQQVYEMKDKGWYSYTPYMAIPEAAEVDPAYYLEIPKIPQPKEDLYEKAQQYFNLGDLGKAKELYQKRCTMGDSEEEIYHSLFQLGVIAVAQNDSEDNILKAFMTCHNYRPSRAEALHQMAIYYRSKQKFEQGYLCAKEASKIPFPSNDTLGVCKAVYDYQIMDEIQICAWWIGKYQESLEIGQALLKNPAVPASELIRLQKNLAYAEEKVGIKPNTTNMSSLEAALRALK